MDIIHQLLLVHQWRTIAPTVDLDQTIIPKYGCEVVATVWPWQWESDLTCIKRISLTLTVNLTQTPILDSGSVQICDVPSNRQYFWWRIAVLSFDSLFQQCLASFSLPRSKFRRLSYKTDYAFVAQTNVVHSAIRQRF